MTDRDALLFARRRLGSVLREYGDAMDTDLYHDLDSLLAVLVAPTAQELDAMDALADAFTPPDPFSRKV